MLERFGDDARRIVVRAVEHEARALGSATVEAEHLLLAVAVEPGPAGRLLAASGLDHAELRAALRRETQRSLQAVGVDASDFVPAARPTPSPRGARLSASAKRALERARQAASARSDRTIGAAHVLVGILRADLGTVPRALASVEHDRIALLCRAEGLLG